MSKKQKQEVGDHSTAIQVGGDLTVTSYQDIRAIFNDLFELNFPKIQQIAAGKARESLDEMLEELRSAFERHKETIDKEKFTEPGIQYEMEGIAIDVARRGKKSNMEMLCELLCTITSRDCPELIELVAGEARRAIPMLSKKHLSYLSVEVIVKEAEYEGKEVALINAHIALVNNHIIHSKELKFGDLQYLNSLGVINQRGIRTTGIIPNFIKNLPVFENKKDNEIKDYCKENGMVNILNFFEIMEVCYIGSYYLTATGRLIGWLNLAKFSHVDIKKLF